MCSLRDEQSYALLNLCQVVANIVLSELGVLVIGLVLGDLRTNLRRSKLSD